MSKKNPLIFLAMALTAFVLGALLLLVHVGTGNMKTDRVHYKYFGSGVPQSSSRNAGGGRAGAGKKAENKPQSILDSLRDLLAPSPPAAVPVNERQPAGRAVDMDQDASVGALDRFYRENYAQKFEPGGEFYAGPDSGRASWPGSSGGRSFTGGAGSRGAGASAQWLRSAPPETTAAPASASVPASPGSGKSASGGAVPATVFGSPVSAGRGRTRAPPPLFASNPPADSQPGSGQRYGFAGGPGGSSSSGGKASGGRAGGISGMSGGSGARGGAGGGAAEGMKAGAQSSYEAQMGGGVAAAASAAARSGGNSSPAAVAAKQSSGGFGGGDSGGSGNTKAANTGDTGASSPSGKPAVPVFDNTYTPPDANARTEEEDLLKTIVAEKLDGRDARYVDEETSRGGESVDKMLKAGTTEGDGAEKGVAVSTGPVDPEDLAKLPVARKAEMKKKIHTFLKRVERKYGVMRDINCTSCRTAADVCDKHKLKGSFLTMKTDKGTTLVVSMKYVKNRWRMHTVDFKAPESGAGAKPDENAR